MPLSPTFEIRPDRIRAAVFDLGGVLMAGGPSDVIAFGDRMGLEAGHWERLRRDVFGNDGTWAELERGEKTLAEFVEALRVTIAEGGTQVTAEEARTFLGVADPFSKRSVMRARMLDRVRAFRAVMPTALLTNNVREWREGWRNALDLEALFDVVVDSSDVGARKPEPPIYEITRERLGVAHDAIFFVDDIGQNLKAARGLGWQTHLFREEDDALAVLDRVLAGAQARAQRDGAADARGSTAGESLSGNSGSSGASRSNAGNAGSPNTGSSRNVPDRGAARRCDDDDPQP